MAIQVYKKSTRLKKKFRMTENHHAETLDLVENLKNFARRRRNTVIGISTSPSYDNFIHKSINQKRISQTFSKSYLFDEVTTKNHTYDQFLIVGLPKSDDIQNPGENPEPKILIMYPSSPLLFSPAEYDQVVKFCFPSGFNKAKPNPSCITDQFVFKLTSTDGSPIYGVCTQFNVHGLQPMFFFDNESQKYPFCVCFLSSNPLLAPNLQYGSFLVLWMCQQIKYLPHPDPSLTFTSPSEQETTLLPGMVWAAGAQRLSSFRIPRALLTELTFYHRVSTCPLAKQDFTLAAGIKLVLPESDARNGYILYPGLSYLFSFLSIKNVIKVFSLILLEAHVLFVSSDLMRLTLSLLSAVELTSPFKLQCPIMPVIPKQSNYITLFESPTPYVAGFIVTEGCDIPGDVAIVNLDKDTIIDNDNLPIIPNANKLLSEIKSILDKQSSQILVPQKYIRTGVLKKEKSLNQEYINFIKNISDFACPKVVMNINPPKYIFTEDVTDKISDLFKNSIAPIVDSLVIPCFVTETTDISNPVTVFNKDLFLSSVEKDAMPFYTHFLSTSIFQQYCDSKTDEKDALLVSRYSEIKKSKNNHRRTKRNLTSIEPNVVVSEVLKDRIQSEI